MLQVLRSTSSYGRYVVHLSASKSLYFWRKSEAIAFLRTYTGGNR